MSAEPPSAQGDGAGAERILHAAIDLFGRHGVKGASFKAIAEQADVSPALIVHHFGSKDRLRAKCDEYVAETIRAGKTAAIGQGPHLDPFAALATAEENRPILRYLARTLTDGSPHVNDLIDELVTDATEYVAQAEQAGTVKPSADPYARVVMLVLWSMGVLVLHEHLERLLGADLLGDGGNMARYIRPVMEVYHQGVLEDGAYQELVDLIEQSTGAADEGNERDD